MPTPSPPAETSPEFPAGETALRPNLRNDLEAATSAANGNFAASTGSTAFPEAAAAAAAAAFSPPVEASALITENNADATSNSTPGNLNIYIFLKHKTHVTVKKY